MRTVLNKIDLCSDQRMIDRVRFKYPKTVAISALKEEGFDRLTDLMIQEIGSLRKKVHLRIPQSQYAFLNEVMKEGRLISREYEENDILVEIEIPASLERRVAHYVVSNSG